MVAVGFPNAFEVRLIDVASAKELETPYEGKEIDE